MWWDVNKITRTLNILVSFYNRLWWRLSSYTATFMAWLWKRLQLVIGFIEHLELASTSSSKHHGSAQSTVQYNTHHFFSVYCVFTSLVVAASNGVHSTSSRFPKSPSASATAILVSPTFSNNHWSSSCGWQTVDQFVWVSGLPLGLLTTFYLALLFSADKYLILLSNAPSLTRKRVCSLQWNHSLIPITIL
jgi:hypothetical protein